MAANKKKSTNAILYVVFGLLILSLGGFGVTSFGSSVRSIGAVGDTDISASRYNETLRRALQIQGAQTGSAPSIGSAEGQQVADQVRKQLLAEAALKEETARLGLSVGDAAVHEALVERPEFFGLDGAFDRELYSDILRRSGLNATQYEAELRALSAANLTAGGAIAGYETHETMVDILATYLGERRDMAWLKLDASALATPVPEPTEAEIQAAYEADPDLYTAPEMRDITYVSLTPEMVLANVTVAEEDLRKLYDERVEEYNKPERRLVERLVFPDQAAAEAAKASLDGGATFESLVAGRGLTLTDIDLGDVTVESLGEQGPAIFEAEAPGVVGPLETSLGPALFRINAVLAADVTPFEEVRDDLAEELQRARAASYIDNLREDIDNRLAGGATLEEVAEETEMELGTIRLGPDTAEGIAAYAAFREAAAKAETGDFLTLITLEDGGLASLRLDAIVPPTLEPLETVRERVIADWTRAETEAQLGDLGEAIRAARLEGKSFADQGYTPEAHADLARESYLDGSPAGAIDSLFSMKVGDVVVFAEGEALHVIELTRIAPLDDGEDATALRASIAGNIARSTADEVLGLFVAAIEADAGITLDQAAINAVNANLP